MRQITQAKSNMYSPKRPALPSLEGVVGACKRGRRKGRRNKTSAERASAAIIDQKRVEKNAREKMRVKNVNHGFELLRRAIGQKRTGKNPTKLATLEAAIKYIHELRTELGEIPLYANTPKSLSGEIHTFAADSSSVRDSNACVAMHTFMPSVFAAIICSDWRIVCFFVRDIA